VSKFFALPSYQQGLQVAKTHGAAQPLHMRGVPNVCGDADPQTGYEVRVDGTDTVIGGTSAVAPLWAGLIADQCNEGQPGRFRQPGALQSFRSTAGYHQRQ
jgi:kumamolisin